MSEARTPDGFDRARLDRREFLRLGAQAAVLLGPAGSLFSLASCARGEGAATTDSTFATAYRSAVRRAEARGAAREIRLVAEVGDIDLGPLGAHRTWLYNGQFPGPELRVREGERLRVTLVNRLPDPTTIHWHGIPLPNAMDGVPGVTQPAVAPGETFVYDYVAEPAGSYMYHSHFALQLDRGLYGPLVIEERAPHVAYDREYTLLLDDFLPGATRNAQGGMMGGSGGMVGGRGGRMGGRGGLGGMGRGSGREGAAPSAADTAEVGGSPGAPSYRALLINGRPPADPATLDVTRGQRVRLRILNPSSATTFRVAVAGHRMRVTHADGQPLQPVEVDALVVGMGERYDVVIEARIPSSFHRTWGAWSSPSRRTIPAPGSSTATTCTTWRAAWRACSATRDVRASRTRRPCSGRRSRDRAGQRVVRCLGCPGARGGHRPPSCSPGRRLRPPGICAVSSSRPRVGRT